jgi:hypothetical protein
MHIQLEEAQVIWWVVGSAASAVGLIIYGMWLLLGRFRDDVAKQITESNAHIESHLKIEEERWNTIYDELRGMREMFVTREVLNLRLVDLESKIELIRKMIDTRRSQRRWG